jgi:four helix bundle protein
VAQRPYDVTVRFCDRYIEKRSRTHDQMVQAARSGVQNIAEGSQASGTSKKTELKLTNVARASLEELRLDYEDYLRQRGLTQWARHDERRQELIAGSVNSVASCKLPCRIDRLTKASFSSENPRVVQRRLRFSSNDD